MSEITMHFANIEALADWCDERAKEKAHQADSSDVKYRSWGFRCESFVYRDMAEILRESVIEENQRLRERIKFLLTTDPSEWETGSN